MFHKILLSIHHESVLHHPSPWAYLREERHLDITLDQGVDLLGFCLFVCLFPVASRVCFLEAGTNNKNQKLQNTGDDGFWHRLNHISLENLWSRRLSCESSAYTCNGFIRKLIPELNNSFYLTIP